MWRKCYPTMYEGSMVGSGAIVFAVWGYIIAKQEPDKEHGSRVRLNPKVLSTIIGETEDDIVGAIERLCSKDDFSTTKAEGGRRLVQLAEFDYRVVNGEKYMDIAKSETRRSQLREAQARYRIKKKSPDGKLPGENAAVRAEQNGATQEQVDHITTESLPVVKKVPQITPQDESERLREIQEDE